MSDLAALRSYLVVVVHDRWALLLVLAVLVTVGAGAATVTGSDAGPERADVVGTLEVHVAGVPDGIQAEERSVTIPQDGVLPTDVVDHLEVTATLESEHPSLLDNETEIKVNTTVSRENRVGTLWVVDRYTVTDTVSPPDGVSIQVDPARALDDAHAVDDHLGTDGGRLVLDIKAAVKLPAGGSYTARVPVRHEGDHLVTEHRDRVVITKPSEPDDQTPLWPGLLGATSVVSLLCLGWLRVRGAIPIQPEVVDLHRAHAVRWRYRHRTVNQSTPIDTTEATRLETVRDVVRLGDRINRPVVTDTRGTVAVDVDGTRYAWWPGGSA